MRSSARAACGHQACERNQSSRSRWEEQKEGTATSDLPTIVKLRYDLERWLNGRGSKIINKTVNVIDVIDSNSEIVFEDAATGATFRVDIKELVT
jgi:hypothetical protein